MQGRQRRTPGTAAPECGVTRDAFDAELSALVRSYWTGATRDALLARLRAAQSVLACAEPGRRLDPCTCWHGYEAAIRIVEEAL